MSQRAVSFSILAIACAAIFSLAQEPDAARTSAGDAAFRGMRYRSIGPFRGGRVNSVTGVPGQAMTFYFGSVGGGVWKSTDAGRTWLPIFDSQPVASIGAVAVAWSNPGPTQRCSPKAAAMPRCSSSRRQGIVERLWAHGRSPHLGASGRLRGPRRRGAH